MTVHFGFDNTYARLPASFHAAVQPSPMGAPRLLKLNTQLAEDLGLDADALAMPEAAEMLAGMRAPDGAEPIALAYAGHQFGNFVPQLGDGRALLLGEIVGRDGQRRDIQLKGSGPTPFSRNGDGRAALGPVLREYVLSEAMAALGIPTTRALAIVATGESVFRETLLPGAVLTRVAASHIRIGTFQYFAARRDIGDLKRLADYAIDRHYPELAGLDRPYHALLAAVAKRQAELVARWMLVGFIHGVMNTDNMTISGETIDYGPCAFMDAYHPATVFSAIDRNGRYAYVNQPGIAEWNLTRLAECLLPLLSDDMQRAVEDAEAILGTFAGLFNAAHLGGMRRKLGLATEEDGDLALAKDLLDRMAANATDFTLTFRTLCDAAGSDAGDAAVEALFADPATYRDWAARWRERLGREPLTDGVRSAAMRRVNPAFVPRNHQVERAIRAAVDRGDLQAMEELLSVLARPYEDQPGREAFAKPPIPEERVHRTFCGT